MGRRTGLARPWSWVWRRLGLGIRTPCLVVAVRCLEGRGSVVSDNMKQWSDGDVLEEMSEAVPRHRHVRISSVSCGQMRGVERRHKVRLHRPSQTTANFALLISYNGLVHAIRNDTTPTRCGHLAIAIVTGANLPACVEWHAFASARAPAALPCAMKPAPPRPAVLQNALVEHVLDLQAGGRAHGLFRVNQKECKSERMPPH